MCPRAVLAGAPAQRGGAQKMAVLADFRSDTVTRPTPAMLKAMLEAPVGDDVFGDDPTVLRLEEEMASLLGTEAALFVVSGTMSNQLALRTHVGPLDEVLCDYRAHIHTWEVGGIHALCGASVAPAEPVAGEQFLDAAAVELHTRRDHSLYHQPITKLLALENTLNGAVAPLPLIADAVATARGLGLSTHLDGARLFNAVAASGGPLSAYGALFDTVSVCLSKGLGAPVGSVLCGSAERIDKARHYRKLYGGGWRQAGVLAAAGLHALAEHRERLLEDHEHAAELAEGLEQLGFAVQRPETNMVWCGPPDALSVPFETVAERLRTEERILVGGAYGGPGGRNPWGEAGKSLRFVTHLQTPRSAVRALLAGLAKHLKHV